MTGINFIVKLRMKSGFTQMEIPEIRKYVKDAILDYRQFLEQSPDDLCHEVNTVVVNNQPKSQRTEESVLLESILQMHDHGHHPIKDHHANMVRKLLKK